MNSLSRGVELKRALERHERGVARVIPIILCPVFWECTSLGNLQVLPQGGKPVTIWSDREKVWRDPVQTLSHVVDDALQQAKRV